MEYTIKSKTKFYIGDPCYVLPDEIYYDIWGDKHNFSQGEIKIPSQNTSFSVVPTVVGDGVFTGNYFVNRYLDSTNVFGVDSGTIAIIPIELCKDYIDPDAGMIVNYTGEVSIELDDDNETIFVNWGDSNELLIALTEDDEDEEWYEYDDWDTDEDEEDELD
jgi:hypothetical protein